MSLREPLPSSRSYVSGMEPDPLVHIANVSDLLEQQLRSAEALIELNQAISRSLMQRDSPYCIDLSDRCDDPPPSDRMGHEGSHASAAELGRVLLRDAISNLFSASTPDVHEHLHLQYSSRSSGAGESSRDRQMQQTEAPRDCDSSTSSVSSLKQPLLPKDALHLDIKKLGCMSESPTTHADDLKAESGRSSPQGVASKRRKRHVMAAPAPKKKRTEDDDEKKREYNVEDLYNTEGFAQEVARNAYFQNCTLIVIVLNTFWMAIDTDYNHAAVLCEAPIIFQVMDNVFCSYFTFEIGTRFFAFRTKLDAVQEKWFVFDASLVLLMIWETWIQTLIYLTSGDNPEGGMRSATVLRLFRAFRLLRISRMTRLLRFVPELFILVKSIGAAMRCMFVTLCMLMLVIYVFSIMFTQLMAGTPTGKGHFDSVPQSMNFMLTSVLCGFDAKFINLLLADSWVYYVLWLIYVLIGSLSIMNVLIGILCEVVSGTADSEKERAVKTDIANHICDLGQAEENFESSVRRISKRRMIDTLENPRITMELEEIGIDVYALLDFVEYYEDATELLLSEFVDIVVQFRGNKPTTVNDLISLRKYITMEVHHLNHAMQRHALPQKNGLKT